MARKMVCIVCKGKGARRDPYFPELFRSCGHCKGKGGRRYVRSPHVKTSRARKRVKKLGICAKLKIERRASYNALKRARHFGPMTGWENEK